MLQRLTKLLINISETGYEHWLQTPNISNSVCKSNSWKFRQCFTKRVCSNWALRLPSAVTAVQPSGHIRSRQTPKPQFVLVVHRRKKIVVQESRRVLPALIMGSMVKVCPAFIIPTVLFPAYIKVNTEIA